jgi:hypothetical protein
VYAPLELLLFIAGCCTLADSFVPQLINVPKATVTQVVRAVLSMSFVMGAGSVVYNLKSRFCKEQAWQVRLGAWKCIVHNPLEAWKVQQDCKATAKVASSKIGHLLGKEEVLGLGRLIARSTSVVLQLMGGMTILGLHHCASEMPACIEGAYLLWWCCPVWVWGVTLVGQFIYKDMANQRI